MVSVGPAVVKVYRAKHARTATGWLYQSSRFGRAAPRRVYSFQAGTYVLYCREFETPWLVAGVFRMSLRNYLNFGARICVTASS